MCVEGLEQNSDPDLAAALREIGERKRTLSEHPKKERVNDI